MTNWTEETNDEEGLQEREAPDESDADDESDEMIICTHCGRAVYYDAALCPGCGYAIETQAAVHRKPLWIFAGVVVCMLVVILLWIR